VWLTIAIATALTPRALAQPPAPEPPLETAAPAQADPAAADAPVQEDSRRLRYRYREIFRLGNDYTLDADDEAGEVIVLSGNTTIEGHVYRDVTVIFGRATIGPTAVIDGSLTVIGGSASISDGAVVDRDLVVIGGDVAAPASFTPGGEHIAIGAAALGGRLERVVPWLTRGLLIGRLIVPDISWIWGVVALFFLAYLALNLLFNRPVRASADKLAEKPFSAFLVGLLVLLLAGPVLLLLTVSIVGLVVVPFVVCAVLLAWILGKIGVARWIGFRILPEDAEGSRPATSLRLQAIRSFTIGFAILCIAYMIPVLGILVWATVGVLGLGAASMAFMAGYRRENPVVVRAVAPFPPPGESAPPETVATAPPPPVPPTVPPEMPMQTAPEMMSAPTAASTPAGAPRACRIPRCARRSRSRPTRARSRAADRRTRPHRRGADPASRQTYPS
jgi:hypothetical protein